MLKNVKCARCVKCGKEYEATANLTNCSCGGILDIIYDYDYIKENLTKETLKPLEPPEKGKGSYPLTPHIGSFYLEELHALRNQVRCTWLRHEPLRFVTTLNRALLS